MIAFTIVRVWKLLKQQAYLLQQIVPTLPASLSADFRNFMQKCLALNEQERWTAEKLLSHPFIQVQEKEGDDSDNKRVCLKQCL